MAEVIQGMRKETYFASRLWDGWPDPDELKSYFLAPPGQRWFFETRNDSAGLSVEGVEGTDHFGPTDKRRIDIHLSMWGHPEHGVLLIYKKIGGSYGEVYSSRGNPSRLKEHVRSLHDTLLPVGLFIPFEDAWLAVKEFIETDGDLPKSIEWIANDKLPWGTFPPP
jgi:hypothetical protein